MLRGKHYGGCPARHTLFVVFDRDLRLSVRAEIADAPVTAHGGKPLCKGMRIVDRRGHILLCFRTGITEHHSLVACADIERALTPGLKRVVDSLRNIRRLLVKPYNDIAGAAVKALIRTVVTDIEDRLPGELLDIHICPGGYLPHDQHKPGRRAGFACHAGHRVLPEHRIEHGIRYPVADLIRMAFRHRF